MGKLVEMGVLSVEKCPSPLTQILCQKFSEQQSVEVKISFSIPNISVENILCFLESSVWPVIYFKRKFVNFSFVASDGCINIDLVLYLGQKLKSKTPNIIEISQKAFYVKGSKPDCNWRRKLSYTVDKNHYVSNNGKVKPLTLTMEKLRH